MLRERGAFATLVLAGDLLVDVRLAVRSSAMRMHGMASIAVHLRAAGPE